MLAVARTMNDDTAATVTRAPLLLRALALLGALASTRQMQWAFEPRPVGEWFYTAVAAAAGIAMLWFATPRAREILARHKDLLVPCGCYLLAREALAFLPFAGPASLFQSLPSRLEILLPMLLMLAAHVVVVATFAVWQTLAIVQVLACDGLDLVGELRQTLRLLPRGMAIVAIAYVAVQGPLILVIVTGIALNHGMLLVFLLGWAICALVFGVVTCLWLPLALDTETGLLDSLRNATEAAIGKWRRNARLIVPWAFATGFLTVRYVSTSSFGRSEQSTSWQAQPDWYGEYVLDSGWYTNAAIADAPALAWFALPLMALFACVAIAVKLTLIRNLDDGEPFPPGDPKGPPPEANTP